VIGYGTYWIVKGRSGCDRGCRRYEFSWREKTLVLKKAHKGCCEPNCVHTRAAQWVGCVHTCVALLTGRVPIDILVSVEDCIIFSVGAELCKLMSLSLQNRCSCGVDTLFNCCS
jgi:hypothetical protein